MSAFRRAVTIQLPALRICVLIALLAPGAAALAQEAELTGAAAVADAVLSGRVMPPPGRTAALPSAVQNRLAEYRRCEAAFTSGLTPPPGATPEEHRVFEQRVGIERVVSCLFAKRGVARTASAYALDADLGFSEAAFIDRLLEDLPEKWLAPYLNLIAGDLKLCSGNIADGRRQLAAARDGGEALIRAVADHLLTSRAVRPCSPLP